MIRSLIVAWLVGLVGGSSSCSEIPRQRLRIEHPLTFEDRVVSIGEVQSEILWFLHPSERLDYRKVCRCMMESVDLHRPPFFLTSPSTFVRKYRHHNIYRSSIVDHLSVSLLHRDARASQSFADAIRQKGTLRLLVAEFYLEYLSTFDKAFWNQFQRFELFVELLSTPTCALLSIFEGLDYDLVLDTVQIMPDFGGHLNRFLRNAKKIKSIKLFDKAGFDAWKQYANKTEMVFVLFDLTGQVAEEVGGFLVDRVRNGNFVWINRHFHSPDTLPFLPYIHAFDMAEYSGQIPDVLRKCDQIEEIEIRRDPLDVISLDYLLMTTNPNITNTLTELTVDGLSFPDGLLDASVRVLRSVETFHILDAGDMDLRFLSNLPYLEDLRINTIENPGSVRLPTELGAYSVHISRDIHLINCVSLTAENLSLEYLHPSMELRNTKYLTITRIGEGTMIDLLAKFPITLEYLDIIDPLDIRDQAVLDAALQEEKWAHLKFETY